MADDTWGPRDLPVLDAAVTLVDENPFVGGDVAQISERSGVTREAVIAALRALEVDGFVDARWYSGGNARVTNVSGHARQLVGAWPNPDAYTDRFIRELDARIEQAADEDERSRLARFRDALLGAGRDIFVDVTAAVLTRQIPGVQ